MIRFGRDLATEAGMAGKDISVKKYVVRLSAGEREHLQALIRKGKSPAKRLLKARILLKADVSEAGEGWSDSRIIQALDTSASMIYRVRKQLVEEGFEAMLSRKRRMTPCRLPAGVPGRDLEATHCRDAHANPDETRTCSPHRLRVRAQRYRQPVHAVRAARRLAPRRGDGPPHRRRLRSRLERSGRSPLPARQDHRAGPGQSQHPQQGVTLRSLSGGRSQTAGRALRMALYAQARQLARSGGIRTRCPLRSVSRSPHPRQTDPHRGNRRLGTRPKCQSHKGRLAIHNPIRSSQTQVPIPFDLAESAD